MSTVDIQTRLQQSEVSLTPLCLAQLQLRRPKIMGLMGQ